MNEKQLDLAPLEDRILFDVAPLDAQVMEPAADSVDLDADMDLFNWADTSQSSDSWFIDFQFAELSAEAAAEQQLDEIESLLEAEIDSHAAINIAAEYKQLIVVDQGVDNYLDLIDAAIASNPPEHFEIMLIDSSESALQRINERLSETSYSAIHLVAHGQDGELSLGNEVWNRDFVATNATGFSVWSQRLSVDADLMIYGCNVAETEFGVAFVDELSDATGTDIAASSDLSGSTESGGDWDLEHQTGAIEHSVLFDISTESYWVGLLDVQVDMDVTIDEDVDYSFAAADFSTDLTIHHVEIISLPQNGVLKLSGADVATGQVISKADLDAGNLVFEPATNQFGTPYDSFEFRIFDGTEYSSESSLISLLLSNFSSNSSGFTYDDNAFGSGQSDHVSGQYESSGGNSGGALVVDVVTGTGGVLSGGWVQTINVTEDTIARISVDHRLELSGKTDDGEFAEGILEVNGVRIGSALARLDGVNGNGPDHDAGWQTDAFEIRLTAGANTIAIGGSNNFSNGSSEWARVTFDNISIEELIFSEFEINVDSVNDAPYDITLDNLSVDENAVNATIGNLGATDVDVGDTITYTISDNRFEVVSGSVLRLKSGVSLDYEMEPTVALTVSATDIGGLTSNQGFTITVNDIDETNTAHAFSNSYSVIEDNSVGGNLINDNTGDGTDYGFGALVMTTAPVVLPTNGTVTLLSDGNFSYSPDPDFAGNDSFQYEITDANGAVATATVDITVVAVNDAPDDFTFTNLDVAENSADNALIGTIVVDDPDVGDAFTYTLLDSAGSRFSINLAGQLLVADGSRLDFEDVQTHSIDVRIEDTGGESLIKTFTVQLLDVNDAPVANDDSFSLNEGGTITVSSSVFLNDTDQDGGVLTGNLLDGPDHGTIAWNTDGTFEYTHNGSETTNDQFSYTVFDPSGASDTATVSIGFTPVNDAPIAVGESRTMVGDDALRVKISKLLQNDSDAEGTGLTFELVGEPSNGTVKIKNGRVVYTPDPGFVGREQVFYRVSDGVSFSNTVAIDISVNLAPLDAGASGSNETEEPAAVEEEDTFSEQVDETDESNEEVEIAAILESDDDDEVVLQRLGQMAGAQSIENELGLRSDSATEDAERYEFTSDLRTSNSFGNDLDSYTRFRVASDQDFENFSTSTMDYQTAGQFDFSYLSQDLDNFDQSFKIDGTVDQVTFATLSSVTSALTVGYVLWMVRGGMLMASFVSSIPAWQSVDPLNIVEFGSIGGGDVDEESLESIVTQFSNQA